MLSLVGGKAATLSFLQAQGIPVPAFFVVPNTVTQMTKEESIGVLQQADTLDATVFAVRSSASVEDGEQRSWAGQFESYLGVSKDEIIGKIELCWKSASEERVQQYATSTTKKIKMAVIVQKQIEATFSGVAFTQNPVNKTLDQMVIEMVPGLGDALVQGEEGGNGHF